MDKPRIELGRFAQPFRFAKHALEGFESLRASNRIKVIVYKVSNQIKQNKADAF